MNIHLYWVSALTYAIVIGMILLGEVRGRKVPGKVERNFRLMAVWIMFFCIQDTVWGLCDADVIKSDSVFYASSSVFHMSTVVTTFFWLKYVLEYLDVKAKFKKLLLVLDGIIIGAELFLVVMNGFKTTLFCIVDGRYVTGPLRPLTFVNQYAVYLLIGVVTFVFALKKRKRNDARYRYVFFFALAPILLGIFQLLYPNAPFYSLGYFLGFFIVHIFVVAKDREEYFQQEEQLQEIVELNRELETKQREIDEQFEILTSLEKIYEFINMIDLEAGIATRFDRDDLRKDEFDMKKDPHTGLNKELAHSIADEDGERFWQFTNLSTLKERMSDRRVISADFTCKNDKWIRAMYVRIGDDIHAPLNQVAYTWQNITSDRKKEHQVYSALSNLVYSLHVVDLEEDTMEGLIESDILKKLIGDEESGQELARKMMRGTCREEYLDQILEFIDFRTITERTRGKQFISCEFLGKYHGWTRMSIVPIEIKDGNVKKMAVTTQIIDSEKTEIMNLIYKSTTDELTRLYNRRMYEDDLDAIMHNKDMDKCVVVALDVNGLKTVNDTLGHKAGDELIIGAGNCINQSFISVGKSYRTGGDEFMVIARCDEEKIKSILTGFEAAVSAWSGYLVKKLSISYGYAMAKEYPELSVRDLASEADKRMYESKEAYYRESGIERRKQ